ncbi:MAG TPA: DUF1028 domain-containing protein [Bryobacteraceae bacterium]|nr:DUF1028 domain-containing protein [Bryobacteraceae bacterium]
MTYSIIARDPDSGELGIALQSRFFAVGRTVPWIEAGVGVVASQSFANPVYGYQTLRLLRAGQDPQAILDQLLRDDPDAATRQVAILDSQGRIAVHTGARCVSAAGHMIGSDCCAQANMMARDTVWRAMVHAYENARGPMADRLLAALEAAEREGGDVRGKQAASLIVVSGKPSGVPELDRLVDLRVDDHPEPVAEVKRLLNYSRAHQRAGQAIDKLLANDLRGATMDLDSCCAAYPNEPEFLFRRALALLVQGRIDESLESLGRAHSVHPGWSELLLRFADAGVIPVACERLEPLVASIRASGGQSAAHK